MSKVFLNDSHISEAFSVSTFDDPDRSYDDQKWMKNSETTVTYHKDPLLSTQGNRKNIVKVFEAKIR